MNKYRIYIVDDESSIRDAVTMALEDEYEVKDFDDAEKALAAIGQTAPDLVLLDIGLPGISGIDALREIRKINHEILIIMITAFDDVASVVAAMKLGAYDYVVKPLEMHGLGNTISNALESIKLRKEVHALQEQYLKENIPCFISESDVIHDIMDFVGKVAKSPDTPVLIIGETGTGKELIADAVHYRSPNFKGPLIKLNCAAIPKDLIESELFGYEAGAFSGASPTGKKGVIEEASGGTLFLDEVGDLSSDAQAKLLRFLENGEFHRVGSTKTVKVATRVVSATNKDIEDMIKKDLFRPDLYYRLGVIKIKVPSLNERPEDIPPLTKYFMLAYCKKFGKNFNQITDDAMQALKDYRWTGNIRELRNIIEKAILTCDGPILTRADLDLGISDNEHDDADPGKNEELPPLHQSGIQLDSILESMEKHYFKEALRMARGNESQAARLLGMNHHTFRYRKRKLGID